MGFAAKQEDNQGDKTNVWNVKFSYKYINNVDLVKRSLKHPLEDIESLTHPPDNLPNLS